MTYEALRIAQLEAELSDERAARLHAEAEVADLRGSLEAWQHDANRCASENTALRLRIEGLHGALLRISVDLRDHATDLYADLMVRAVAVEDSAARWFAGYAPDARGHLTLPPVPPVESCEPLAVVQREGAA